MAPGDASHAAAVRALQDDAGCAPARARALVDAVAGAAADEALDLVAGRTPGVGSALDRRVATLARVIAALDPTERVPDPYEVGAIFRITPTQARNVLRTYQARHSDAYRARFSAVVGAVEPKREKRAGTNVFVFAFDDPAVLEFAAERLRRRGLTRGVTIDAGQLELVVERDARDRFGLDAVGALKAE